MIVSVLRPPGEMVVGLNDLASAGGATTVSDAVLLVAPVPASVDVTALVVLSLVPAVVPVTATLKVQADPGVGDAANVPPDKLTFVLPGVAVMAPLPHEPVTFGDAATTSPAGKLSLKPTPLRPVVVFGLLIVKLNVLVELSGIVVGLKALVMVGLAGNGLTVTTIDADGALVHPFVVVVTV